MWRYYWDKKDTTDDFKNFSISFLKKHWYLDYGISYRSWGLTWWRWETKTWDIWFDVTKDDDTMKWFVRVHFTQTERHTEEKKDFDYKIPIVATNCNFWGIRWWFIDPCSKNETKCTILYLQSNWYFASRKTLNLSYHSQNESKFWRTLTYLMGINSSKADEIRKSIKYPYRNGKPTRKMKRFIKLSHNRPTFEEMIRMEQNLLNRWTRKK